MNCTEFENLLADALGDELAAEQRMAFETHVAECERCRAEYEADRRAVAALEALPRPHEVVLRRVGNSMVVDERGHRTLRATVRRAMPRLRLAASLLVAFTAGFAARNLTTAPTGGVLTGQSTGQRIVAGDTDAPGPAPSTRGRTLRDALLSAHQRKPAESDFAKCLTAILSGRT